MKSWPTGLGVVFGRNRVTVTVLAIGTVIRSIVMLLVKPVTDVYYYDTEAAKALVQGLNPYGHFYGNLPAGILATPGAANVFTYLPFTGMFFVPFYILGDIRLGLILADAVIAASLAWASHRNGPLAPSLYSLFPFTILLSTVIINNTLVSMLFIALFFSFERNGKGLLGASCFGIALASNQFSWLVFPFVAHYYLRNRRWKEPLMMVAVAALIIAPFLATNTSTFVYDTFTFQFVRPTAAVISYLGPLGYNVNLALNAFLLSLLHFSLPLFVRVGIVGAFLPLFLYRVKGSRRLALYSGVFLLVSIFVLPNDFLPSYTELPLVFLLFYAASPGGKSVLQSIGKHSNRNRAKFPSV